MLKPLTVWITTKWKILKELGVPYHPTCLLRNLYRAKKQLLEPNMEKNCFKIGKRIWQGSMLSSAYLTSMQSTSCEIPGWMNQSQAGIKTAGRNINNLRYADDTTLMLKLKLQYFRHLTHWKRPWCWERLRAGGEGSDREWDGGTALWIQWTWVWANSKR